MSKIEAVLRNTCALAADPSFSLPDAISLYRSVATLARAMRTEMADDGLPRGFPPDLVLLLIGVLNTICVRALAPNLTPAQTAILARAIGQISAACHLARPAVQKPLKPAAKPAPAPKPVVIHAAKPLAGTVLPSIPVAPKPIAPEDRALANKLMADLTHHKTQNYKRAA